MCFLLVSLLLFNKLLRVILNLQRSYKDSYRWDVSWQPAPWSWTFSFRNVRNRFLLGVSPAVYGIQLQLRPEYREFWFPLVLTSYTLPYHDTFVTSKKPTLACCCKLHFGFHLNSISFSINGPLSNPGHHATFCHYAFSVAFKLCLHLWIHMIEEITKNSLISTSFHFCQNKTFN